MKKVVIEIRDEVNCRLNGLELTDRRALVKKFEYEIPGARYLPSVRLGRWNGKVSYFALGGSTYINLLPDIIPYLDSAGYDVELSDLREYSNSVQFTSISQDTFSSVVWPKGHPMAGQPIMLRDYQVDIVNNFLGNPQCLQEIATGAGKTLITAALSWSCQEMGRTLVIVPNKSLVAQTEVDYKNLGLDVGVYFGDRKEWGKTHTICTWQSLNVLLKNTKDGTAEASIVDFIDGVVCVIVDECFDGNTKVLTPTGYVPIRNLSTGDKVINYSEKTKEFKIDTVVKQHKNLTKSLNEKMYEMTFDTGATIKVTGNHKFFTSRGWIRADELTENDEILSFNINTTS